MTLRFLDLTLLFKFLAAETKLESNERHALSEGKSWFKQAKLMADRAKQRRELLNLSDHQLDDIGLTREQVITEARKPFWVA